MRSFVAAFGLAGFFAGVLLYFFLFWVLLQRRDRRGLETGLLWLLASLLVWYAGNFLALLLRQMDIAKVAGLLGIVDAVSFLGLAVLPALLLHTHWLYYTRGFTPHPWDRRVAKAGLAALYLPLLFLPFVLVRLFPASQVHPILKVGTFSIPFLSLLAASYYLSCFLHVRILKQSRNPIERTLFGWLLVLFLLIPLFNFWIFLWSGETVDPSQELWTIVAQLLSVVPTLVVIYYIYHYRFLEIVVERGISTVLLILLTLGGYLLGVRRLAIFLERELAAPPLLVEGVFLAAVLLLFPPLSRWLGGTVSRLYSGEIRRYRRLGETLNEAVLRQLDPSLLRDFIERTLERELPASRVSIQQGGEAGSSFSGQQFPLYSGGRRTGTLEVKLAQGPASTAQAEGLRLLANEISIVLEQSRLLQSKWLMERELAQKSHLEELGRMAASVAHNVKNPLSSIKTLIQLMEESENLNTEQRQELGMMLSEIDRLSATVSRLLKFSRLESEAPREPSEVDLRHLLDSLATLFRGDLEAGGVRFESRFGPSAERVLTDGDLLSEILSNLLSNAIDASPRGGLIQIGIEHRDGNLEIAVEDEGPGVPPDLEGRIFEPFFTSKSRGSGLGLAIVKRRVEQLNGTVHLARSQPGAGALFLITMPVKAATMSPENPRRDPAAPRT